MKFIQFETASSFAAAALPMLMENEAQNNLMLHFATHKAPEKSWQFYGVLDDAGSLLLAAVCTPPHNLQLYAAGNRVSETAVSLLAENLRQGMPPLPGVLAEQLLARRFAEAYLLGSKATVQHRMYIMALTQRPVMPEVSGQARFLREDDMFFVPFWEQAFSEECGLQKERLETRIARVATRERNQHVIWEDAFPVSQACISRQTPHGGTISNVYTPPHLRGKGYGRACVAHLCRLMLVRGNQFCALYADAENPISCGIYRKLGFYDICKVEELAFRPLAHGKGRGGA